MDYSEEIRLRNSFLVGRPNPDDVNPTEDRNASPNPTKPLLQENLKGNHPRAFHPLGSQSWEGNLDQTGREEISRTKASAWQRPWAVRWRTAQHNQRKWHIRNETWGSICHICEMFSYDFGSLLNYSIRSEFGNFCFNWSFNMFVMLQIMTSELVRIVSVFYIT
jgi:hypothetical protein